jgi:hypothetical protein
MMRYAELTIVGSFVFALAASVGVGKRTAGMSPRTEAVRCEAAVPTKVDIATAGRTALAALKAPEGDKSIVGARLVLENGRPAWEVRIAIHSQQCVTPVLVDAESGELLSPGPGLKAKK